MIQKFKHTRIDVAAPVVGGSLARNATQTLLAAATSGRLNGRPLLVLLELFNA